MLSALSIAIALIWGGSTVSNGVQFQYGASPDYGQVDDTSGYTGVIYSLDYDLGSDTNNGLSKATPWKTVSRANKACASVGGADTEVPRNSAILLARGQT